MPITQLVTVSSISIKQKEHKLNSAMLKLEANEEPFIQQWIFFAAVPVLLTYCYVRLCDYTLQLPFLINKNMKVRNGTLDS